MAESTDARVRTPEDQDRSLKRLMQAAGVLLLLLVTAIMIFLWLFQWNWLRGPIGRLASARLEREVRLVGDLDVKLLTWTPTAYVQDLRIADAPWADAREPMIQVRRLTVATRWRDLFAGRVAFPLIRAEAPNVRLLRDRQGRANWNFSGEEDDGEAARIPPIETLLIEDGRLAYRDRQRDMEFSGTMESSERVASGGGGVFRVEGRGRLADAPMRLTIGGGPLVNISRDRPYPLTADIRAGGTTITARGSITRPFDLNHFETRLTLEGPDLGDLHEIAGLAAPNTPPYRLSGRLMRAERVFTFNDFSGRVGDSDLSGNLRVALGGARPRVNATLRSRQLDFDDLLAVVGGPPDASETANAEQRAQSANMRGEGRFLPDATLDAERLRAVDADVTYRADTVNAGRLPIRAVSFTVDLENALLSVNPLSFRVPQGRIDGSVAVNGRSAMPRTEADIRIRGVQLESLIPARGGSQPVEGPVIARVRLAGTGNSVRRAVASSDGQITVVIPRGRVRRACAELTGVNVGPGLLQLLSGDQSETPLRCAVADFQVTNGVARARSIVADTDVVLIRGTGQVNLAEETFAIRLDGDSKRPRLVRLFAPINIRGRIASPQVSVEPGGIVAQGGIAAALGALISPLAAILPFVELGTAEDANCGALVAQANRRGAPAPGAQAAVRGR